MNRAMLEQAFDVNTSSDKLGSEWAKWLRNLNLQLVAKDIKDDNRKVATLLASGGPGLQETYYSLKDGAGESAEESFAKVQERLNAYFIDETNDTFERHVYRQIRQSKDETFDRFVLRIRIQVGRCNFGMRASDFIRDQVVEGSIHEKVREDIFKIRDCTLEDAVNVGRTHETMMAKMKNFGKPEQNIVEKSELNWIKNPTGKQDIKFGKYPTKTPDNMKCFRCNKTGHFANSEQCPAIKAKCRKCEKIGHFEVACKSGDRGRFSKKFKPNVHQVYDGDICQSDNSQSTEDIGYLFYFGGSGLVSCNVGGINMSLVIDSGASANMISVASWNKMKENKAIVNQQKKGSDRKFFAYGQKDPIEIRGRFEAKITIGNKSTIAKFYVAEEGKQNLISKETAEKLGVLQITINEIAENIQQFPKVN